MHGLDRVAAGDEVGRHLASLRCRKGLNQAVDLP